MSGELLQGAKKNIVAFFMFVLYFGFAMTQCVTISIHELFLYFKENTMLHIAKNRVQNLLMIKQLAQLHHLNETIELYERRYHAPFAAFEERMNSARLAVSGKEDMAAWDDYIEWLAFEQSRNETLATLKELRNGEFELA